MAERRRYTGTQRLQIAWSLALALALGIVFCIDRTAGLPVSAVVLVLLISVAWFVGLGGLGFRERRQWNRMVSASSFSRQAGPHTADLEQIVDGRSVTVSTAVPGPFSQTYTELRTSVAGVDASFTVQFSHEDAPAPGHGITTGNEQFDDQFAIEGSEQNVNRILSPDVRSALLDIDTPGVCTVTGEHVSYEVPFTSLSAEELDVIADALVVIAARVEDVGSSN